MKIKEYKCKCGCDDFFFADKESQKGIYCSYCGKWLKWADKDEKNLLLKQEAKTDYKSFCEWVASEIFAEDWEYNKDSFAEIACRKLNKLGIVMNLSDFWKLKESEE